MSDYKNLHVIILQSQLISGDVNREPGRDNTDTFLLSSFSVHIHSTGLIFWAETSLLLSFSVQTQLHCVSFSMPIHYILFHFRICSFSVRSRFCFSFDAVTLHFACCLVQTQSFVFHFQTLHFTHRPYSPLQE